MHNVLGLCSKCVHYSTCYAIKSKAQKERAEQNWNYSVDGELRCLSLGTVIVIRVHGYMGCIFFKVLAGYTCVYLHYAISLRTLVERELIARRQLEKALVSFTSPFFL